MSTEQDHAAAFLALLPTPGPPLKYDGFVPDGVDVKTTPYALVYTHLEFLSDGGGNAMDGASKTAVARYTVHCVGGSAQAARAVQGWVRAAVLDRRPTIAGRVCGLIRQEPGIPPNRDESTGSLVVDAVSTYRLRTEPA